MITSIEKLQKALKGEGILLTRDALEMLERYANLIMKWSKRTTIVSKKLDVNGLMGLFFDSLVIAKELEGEKVVDLGTGAGLPGIPLAIIHPEMNFILNEIVRKKCIFLEYAKDTLGLENVKVECCSWDELEGPYDTVVSMGTGYERVKGVAFSILRRRGKFIYITTKDSRCSKRVRNPFIGVDTCVIVSRETI